MFNQRDRLYYSRRQTYQLNGYELGTGDWISLFSDIPVKITSRMPVQPQKTRGSAWFQSDEIAIGRIFWTWSRRTETGDANILLLWERRTKTESAVRTPLPSPVGAAIDHVTSYLRKNAWGQRAT